MRAFLLLLFLSMSITVTGEDFPTDAELLAMAKRRVDAGDFGLSVDQLVAMQRGSMGSPIATGNPSIMVKGTARTDGLPIRFQVMVNRARMTDEDEKTIAVIDAVVRRDEFGTWGMTWRYNTDQTLLTAETQKAAITAAVPNDPDSQWRHKLPSLLKSGVLPAQVQFQGGQYEDRDNNGIGDFAADLEVLNGSRAAEPSKQRLTLLPETFISDLTKAGIKYRLVADAERGFWMFAVLPSGTKTYLISADGVVREINGAVLPASLDVAKEIVKAAKPYRR